MFIVVDSDDDSYDDYDVSVYTGIKNVPDIDATAKKTVSAVALDNKGAVARVVYIEDGDVSGNDEVIFAIANSNAKIQKDSENGEYYEIDAVVNGAKETLEVKAGSTSAVNALVKNIDNDAASISGTKSVVALKSMTENSDGFISSAKVYEAMDADGDGVLNAGDSLYVTGTKKSNDATISTVEMFGIPVENGKVTVPGSANGAGEQRLTFNLADGAKVTGVYYRESTSGNWNSWGDDYKLTANLGQSKLYVKIESVAADGTSTDSYEFEANLGAACTVTINATNALVKIDGKAVSGNVTFSQGETLILTIVPADGMKISDVKWDSGSAIPGFGGEYQVTVPNTATATLNVTAVSQ